MSGTSLLQHLFQGFKTHGERFVLVESNFFPDQGRLEVIRSWIPHGTAFSGVVLPGIPDQPYAPFLTWIRDHLGGLSGAGLDDFLDQTKVYELQRPAFRQFFLRTHIVREEEVILEEFDFEKSILMTTILRQMEAVLEKVPRIFYLAPASGLSCATLEFLIYLMSQPLNYPWLFVIEYHPGELEGAPAFWKLLWDQFTSRMERSGSIIRLERKVLPIRIAPPAWKWTVPRDRLNDFLHFLALQDAALGAQLRLSEGGRSLSGGMDEAFLRDFLGTVYLYLQEYDKASLHFHNLLTIAKEKGLAGVLAEAYRKTGLIQYKKDNSDAAIKLAFQSLKMAENLSSEVAISKALFLILLIDARENQLEQPQWEEYYRRFLRLGENLGLKNLLAYWMARPDRLDPIRHANEVDSYQDKALHILEKIGNLFRLAAAYHTKGFTYIVRGEYKKVTPYYKKSERLKLMMGNPLETAYLQNGMGYFYHQQGHYKNAETYMFKAFQSAQAGKDYHEVGMTLCNLAINYLYGGRPEAALVYLEELSGLLEILQIPGLSYHSPFEIRALTAMAQLKSGRPLKFWELLHKLIDSDGIGQQEESRLQSRYEETLLFLILQALGKNLQGKEDEADGIFVKAEEYYLEHYDTIQYRGNFLYGEWEAFRQKSPGLQATVHELQVKAQKLPWSGSRSPEPLPQVRTYPDFQRIRELARMETSLQQFEKKLEEIQFLKALQIFFAPGKTYETFLKGVLDLIAHSFIADFVSYREYRHGLWKDHRAQGSILLSTEEEVHLKRECENWVNAGREVLYCRQTGTWPQGLPGRSWIAVPVFSARGWTGLLLLGTVRTNLNLTEDDLRILAIAATQITGQLERSEQELEIIEKNSLLEKANLRLNELASIDALTHLNNRMALNRKLHEEKKRLDRYGMKIHETFSILFIDLDNFKFYNDTYGHNAGDLLLSEFAKTLKSVIREVDFAARYGGDEFVLLLPETNIAGARIVAERIFTALDKRLHFQKDLENLLQRPVRIQPQNLLSCSIGGAEFDTHRQADIDALIQEADQALFQAKNEGKRRFIAL